MKNPSSKFLLLLFPLGFLAGYLVPRSGKNEASVPSEHKLTSRENDTKRGNNTSSLRDQERIRSLADKIANRDYRNQSKGEQIANRDIPAVIAHLLNQVGPSGLSYMAQREIDEMLVRWAKEDFDAAYSWASTFPNRNAAKDFLEAILEEHAKTDFDNAMALIKQIQSSSDIKLDLGQQLLEPALKRGAVDAFNLLMTFPSLDGSSSGGSQDFPDDFDFKTFAVMTSEHMKKAGTEAYSPFSFYPTNLLTAWAKVDSQAALDHYLSSSVTPYGELGEITKAFLDIAKPESAYPWITEQYMNLERKERAKFAGDLDSVFPREMGLSPLIDVVKKLPTEALQKEMVSDMLNGFGRGVYEDGDTYMDLLLLFKNPQERLDFIKKKSISYPLSKVTDKQLSAYGITRKEIEELNNE